MSIRKVVSALAFIVAAAHAFVCLPAVAQVPKNNGAGTSILDTGVNDLDSGQVQRYFPSNYIESRENFLAAAKVAGATIESFKHPLSGPNGASLFTDVAALGAPNAEAVLFIGSGTHGVEAFAGAAIQIGLLRRRYGARIPPNTRLVLIHGINPYGFSHLRRFNENNVDLNRNFRDHDKPYPTNAGYDALASAMVPRSISAPSDIAAISRILLYTARHGVRATQTAVTAGQYTHEQGLFFGGLRESWSVKTLRNIVQRYGRGAKRVAFVDVHTGLGPHGQAEIILNVPNKSPAYQRAMAWWGEMVKTTKTGESVSADLTGTLKLAIPGMLPATKVTAVSLEFGTVPTLKALWALRAENWLHHNGGENGYEADRIKTDLLRAFYPDTNDWRSAIWCQGKGVIDNALLGLSDSSWSLGILEIEGFGCR